MNILGATHQKKTMLDNCRLRKGLSKKG